MTKVYTSILLPLFLLVGIMYYNFSLGQKSDTNPRPNIKEESVCTETVLITLSNPLECLGDTDASLLATVTRSPECTGTYMYFFNWKRDGTDVRFELKDFGQLTDELIDIQPGGGPLTSGMYEVVVNEQLIGGPLFQDAYTLIVNDITPPTLSCPGNILSGTDSGMCSAMINFSLPIATDNCDGNFASVQTLGLPSGSQFPLGTSIIEFSATDSSGNTQTCSFNVTVADDEPPQLTCPLNQTVEIMTPDQYVLPDYFNTGEATATDNCVVAITSQNPLPGTMLGEGVHIVSFTALDDAGNESTCSFQLTVDDILGVGDFLEAKGIQLYPNPVSDHLNIVVPDNSEIKKVTLFSTNGKLIHEWIPNVSNASFSIDMARYTDQMYFIRIETGVTITFKKVVKNR